MATPVVMPQMGESIAEGTIVRWIKKVGDTVDRDEPLFEISTDKVDAEIPSPAAGTLLEIAVKEGETVAVNSVVATIGAAGEGVAAAPPAEAAAPAPSGKTVPPTPQADGTPAPVSAPAAAPRPASDASDAPAHRTTPDAPVAPGASAAARETSGELRRDLAVAASGPRRRACPTSPLAPAPPPDPQNCPPVQEPSRITQRPSERQS